MSEKPPNYDELSDRERRQFFESPLFRKYHAYKSLVDGVEGLKDDGPMYDSLRAGVLRRMKPTVRSEDTVDEFFRALREEVKEHTAFVEAQEEE